MADSGTGFDAAQSAKQEAREAGLRWVSDAAPGIRRERHGESFRFIDANGKEIKDEATLARIRKLAIPPAYEQVWICASPRGHLQATGVDARGRKQYRYHPKWRVARDGSKFQRMAEFGAALPALRRRVQRDLKRPGLPRDKVLAAVVNLLDTTLLRIGNEEYARENKSYGLTTLRNRHASFGAGRLRLNFRAKGGVEREVEVDDARLTRIVRRCRQLPGQQLFQYLDDEGGRHAIDSGMVNDYLRETMGAAEGEGFTAKDFRTWGATLRAIALMGCMPLPEPASERAMTACINGAIKQVAQELGNTPAICRKSYINPRVFEAWRGGALHGLVPEGRGRAPRQIEKLALDFLAGNGAKA